MNYKFTFLTVVLLSSFSLGPLSSCAEEIPKKETEQLDFAQGLLARGLYDLSVSEYQKFIAAYPQSPYVEEANLAVGECYFLAQNFPKGIEAFNHFKELYPNSERFPTALLRLGQIYIQQAKFDEALKELTAIDSESKLKGENLQAFYFYIGKAYRGKNDFLSAVNYFQKAAQAADASQQTPYAWQEIAEIHAKNAEYQEAVDAYAQAIQYTHEDNLKGYLIYKLGETQFLAGFYEQATNQFKQVLQQFPALDIAKDAFTNLLLAYFNLKQYAPLLTDFNNNIKLIKEDGSYFAIYFIVVRTYVELAEYEEAGTRLDKILSFPDLKAEDKRKVILEKAEILISQKKYQEGVALLEGPLPESPDDADEISFLKAQGYYGLGDFKKAAEFFEDVRKNHPDSTFVKASVLGMAHAAQELGNPQEAADRFLEYYTNEPDPKLKSEALYELISMEGRLNALKEASSYSEEYLKTFPRGAYYEPVLLGLADLYAKNQQSDKAVNVLQEYLAQPQDIQRLDAVYFLLGYNQQLLGRTDQALDAYVKVSPNKEDPKFYSSALKNSAVIYLNQKKDSQAAALFDRMIAELDQNDLELKTYFWLCDQYLNGRKFDDVLRVATAAEKYFPEQAHEGIAYFKAEAYRKLKNFPEAKKFYDEVLSAAAKSSYAGAAHVGKGLCLSELKQFEEAKSEFQKAIDENPDDHTVTLRARFEIGNIAAEQKNFEEALKFYLLVGTIYDDDYYCPESSLRAGNILENLNRKDSALRLYFEVVEKYKGSPAAIQAKERITVLSERRN